MRRAIVVATCAMASVLAQPLDAQWSVETSNGRRSAVRDEASPGGTGEFAGAGLGGMAQVVVGVWRGEPRSARRVRRPPSTRLPGPPPLKSGSMNGCTAWTS